MDQFFKRGLKYCKQNQNFAVNNYDVGYICMYNIVPEDCRYVNLTEHTIIFN